MPQFHLQVSVLISDHVCLRLVKASFNLATSAASVIYTQNINKHMARVILTTAFVYIILNAYLCQVLESYTVVGCWDDTSPLPNTWREMWNYLQKENRQN